MAAKRTPKDATPRAAGTSTTAGAVSVVAVVTALGWVAPIIGLVGSTGLAIAILVLAPVAGGWKTQAQALVATGASGAYLWFLPAAAAMSGRSSLVVALAGGIVLSMVATSVLDRQREAERVQREKINKRMRDALAAFEIRAGVGGLTQHAGASVVDADDPVASIERIAVELGRTRVEQRKDILKEREMNAHFIGQAAHEFRTPLAVIQTAAEALKLYSGRMSSHAQHTRLTKIEESVQQMTTLLHNALTFSRADAGKIKIERQAVDLRAIAQEVARDVKASHGEREITVAVRGAARLPNLDPSLAREIMINLITNAAKYSPNGGPIEVEVVTGGTEVRIRVTDHGMGIAPGDIEHVFEAFRRGGNVGDIPGTGLGLAITKRAVETHGGTVEVESKLGSGTTFTVTLPDRTEHGETIPSRRAG